MDIRVQHLLDELLELDPAFGEREELSRVLEGMIRVKPVVRVRDGFERELKNQVLEQARVVRI